MLAHRSQLQWHNVGSQCWSNVILFIGPLLGQRVGSMLGQCGLSYMLLLAHYTKIGPSLAHRCLLIKQVGPTLAQCSCIPVLLFLQRWENGIN